MDSRDGLTVAVRAAATCVLLSTPPARPAVVIPPGKQLPASIVTHFAGPEGNVMHMPTDVVADADGRVFVADGAKDRIVRFTSEGKVDQVITEAGGQRLSRPVGLAIDPDNQIWIADAGNRRLMIITPQGKLIRTVDLPDAGQDHPTDPTDVTIAPGSRRAYVVDNDNHRVLIADSPYNSWASLGEKGGALGQFQWPFMICCQSDGYVYVTEAIGARVQRISPTDRCLGVVGGSGVAVGQLYRPKGIAVDAEDRLFVGDSSLGLVQVFTPTGHIEGVLTDPQGHPLQFAHPMGMCFDAEGRLYVVELGANRVAVVGLRKIAPSTAAVSRPAQPKGKEAAR